MVVHIGLDSWIIQDGNYGDFESGKKYRFAVEFYPYDLSSVERDAFQPYLKHQRRGVYDACGEIIFCSESAWVCDFGVPAYREAARPDWAHVGALAKGEVSLNVDPFFYFENLRNVTGMPDLFRHWRVRSIQLETTPWIETVAPGGGAYLYRDDTRESFREVPQTDAWNDDDGHAFYLLECEMRPADA